MMLEPVVVLQVVEGMVVVIPLFNHQCWILLTIQVPEASKLWCDLILNDPVQLGLG